MFPCSIEKIGMFYLWEKIIQTQLQIIIIVSRKKQYVKHSIYLNEMAIYLINFHATTRQSIYNICSIKELQVLYLSVTIILTTCSNQRWTRLDIKILYSILEVEQNKISQEVCPLKKLGKYLEQSGSHLGGPLELLYMWCT